jgi:hypothetical protein
MRRIEKPTHRWMAITLGLVHVRKARYRMGECACEVRCVGCV